MDEILPEDKTSRGSFVTLRTILRTRMFFGFYSNISSNSILRVIARVYCICSAWIISTFLFTGMENKHTKPILDTVLLLEYNFNVLVSFFTGEDHIFKFCRIIDEAGISMGHHDLRFMTPATQFIFLLLITVNTAFPILYAINYFERLGTSLFITIGILKSAQNFIALTSLLSLDLLRHHCLNLYKTLVDSLDVTFPWTKLQITLKFAVTFVVYMVHGRSIVAAIKDDITSLDLFFGNILSVVVACLLACLPCVFAELIAREAEKFKQSIVDEGLHCEDERLGWALTVAAEYLDQRPFRVTFCRVLALDITLAVSYIGLCTTSLIVIIQITGLI